LDDIEKDVTDATGQKEVMGGSVQVENQFSDYNIDEHANDQSKHQLDPEIRTENTEGPESECKDGGDTSINVPGDNIGTDVISPREGASDDKSAEPPVLPSIGVVHANVGQNVTPHNPSLGLFLYHFFHTIVS
jgi:hypothetical protein